jgi:hypothetical protein
MRASTQQRSSTQSGCEPVQEVPPGKADPSEAQWVPSTIASAFPQMRLAQRVRVLRRLLLPVGPMALAVLGGGAFAKYAAQARWPGMSLSLEDAARVTSSQIYELVRYVQQSNPQALQQVLIVLARDSATMAALGASAAAIVMQHVANRRNAHTSSG